MRPRLDIEGDAYDGTMHLAVQGRPIPVRSSALGWNPFKKIAHAASSAWKDVKKGADATAWFVSTPIRDNIAVPRWWDKYNAKWAAVNKKALAGGSRAVSDKEVMDLVATREHINYLVKHRRWTPAERNHEHDLNWQQIRRVAAAVDATLPPAQVIATSGDEDPGDQLLATHVDDPFLGPGGPEAPLSPITVDDPLMGADDELQWISNAEPLFSDELGYADTIARIGGLS